MGFAILNSFTASPGRLDLMIYPGDLAENDGGIVCVLCDGTIKLVTEILLLIHLISAYPMFLNPPNQFFENILGIPLSTLKPF